MRLGAPFVAFALAFVALSAAANDFDISTLQGDPNSVSVSGISAGGYMAVQYHVSHSLSVIGAGVIAAGPYYCAAGNLVTALGACMKYPDLISVPTLHQITLNTASTGFIDNTKGLSGDRVWLFSGKDDKTVHPGVVDKLYEFYQGFVMEDNIEFVRNFSAAHAMITNNFGNKCDYHGSPYINNCDFDAAESILTHIYGNMLPHGTQEEGNLYEFDQSKYIWALFKKLPSAVGMDSKGFIYVPEKCKTSVCKVHMVFHGCDQAKEVIGNVFAMHAGYNKWAETNDMIIVYPQSHSNLLNPHGCFDWWGYAGTNYASSSGVQLSTFHQIIGDVLKD